MLIRLIIILLTTSYGMVVIAAQNKLEQNSQGETYVIVHGAWGGGWAWREMDHLLSKQGHKVYRPTLTGLGARTHLASPDISLEMHILDVVNLLIYEELSDIVLVGHSYGGMIITAVADRVPERVRRLIYLDAYLPEHGESVLALRTENLKSGTIKSWTRDGFIVPPWLDSHRDPPWDVPQPLKTFTDPILLTNSSVKAVPASYILTIEADAKEDSFSPFAERAKKRGFKVITMEADHNPQRSKPKALLKLFITD